MRVRTQFGVGPTVMCGVESGYWKTAESFECTGLKVLHSELTHVESPYRSFEAVPALVSYHSPSRSIVVGIWSKLNEIRTCFEAVKEHPRRSCVPIHIRHIFEHAVEARK
jgi:hypothetical protein